MRVTTPSGVECNATLIGKYDIGPRSRRLGVMIALEPGTDPTPEDDDSVFDWLCASGNGTPLLDALLKSPDQIRYLHIERWSDPDSGRPRVTYDIMYDY